MLSNTTSIVSPQAEQTDLRPAVAEIQRGPGDWAELGRDTGAKNEWPKITLITAVFNGEEYLEATIRSIVNQGYPNLEYIVVDDGSTDRTEQIIRKYQRELHCSFSQPNEGLFAALNAGFAKSSGEIMGWLNSSDLLQVNGLFTVGSIFRQLHEVEWI